MKTMRRRVGRLGVVGAGSALALVVSAALPAHAQVFGPLTIDPAEGPVGTVVTGTVDPAVIAESCLESSAALQQGITDLEQVYTEVLDAYDEATWGDARPPEEEDAQSYASTLLRLVLAGILFDVDGAAQSAWQQSHVLTFADIATQQPVGELSSFDPATGVGQVTVADDMAPGTWAVAATCLDWNQAPTVDDVATAVAAGAAYIEANFTAPYPLGEEILEIGQAVGPDMLGQTFLVPGEQWVELFCVHDATGACPGSTPPDPGPGGPDPTVPADPGGADEPDPAGDDTPPTAGPATPITGVRPTFTG